jgi:putative ABC transport system permease protein
VLVVLSIAVGVSAVGTIAGAATLLERNLQEGYADTLPSHAALFTASPFDRDIVDIVRGMPDVDEAQGRRSITVRMVTGPDETLELQLTALPDFTDQPMDVVVPVTGSFPPGRGEIVFERSSSRLTPIVEGAPVTIQLPGGRERSLTAGGLAKEPGTSPAFYFGRLLGYVTFETLEDLGFGDALTELRIRVSSPEPGREPTRDEARAVSREVRDRLERAGTQVAFTQVPEPGQHPSQDLLDAVFVILGAIGALSLVVSGFLVVNTISAILAQQTRQIGIMKAVGARDGQVAGVYLGIVLAYAAIALAISLPLGALGAWGLTVFSASLLNFDATRFFLPPHVLALEVGIGLLVPLLAAAVPVWRGVRVTVREAVASTGIGDAFGASRFDRMLQRLRGPSRPTLLSIRNTFRRKTRLALTLAALMFGGAVFMSVFTLRASLVATLEDTFRYFNYNVQVELTEPSRTSLLVAAAERVPGVVAAEPWTFASAQRERPDGTRSGNNLVFGLPAGAQTVRPVVEEGRWLLPEDGNAVVVTRNFLDDEPDVGVGDRITLASKGRDAEWTVVGIVQSPTRRPFLYAPSTSLEVLTRETGKASILMVVADDGDPAREKEVAAAVRAELELAGFAVSSTTTASEIRSTIDALFDTMVAFVSVMSIILGVVGGLGLTGTMTMNVVERSREIGVMRAIGARDRAVLLVFLAEGLLIGLLAWLVGVAISLPISKVLADALGEAFLQRPLAFTPSVDGLGTWLVVVAILATFASLLPSWRATRLAVREVLAYE